MCERRLTLVLRLIGFGVAAPLFAYLELTDYATPNLVLRLASFIFCPLSFLSLLFIDIEPHTVGAFGAWFVVALMNSVAYGAIGTFAGRYLCKSN